MSLKSKTLRAAAIVSIAAALAFPDDWPNFHGPNRTNKSAETGLLKEWPKDGPKLLWTGKGIGTGFSGAAVADGIAYTAGNKNKANHVFAFDRSGKLLWEKNVGGVWDAVRIHARMFSGSRSTPTVSEGAVYYLTDRGLLVALDAKTGAEKWSVNLSEKYGAVMPVYGYSESPLVANDRVYAAAYGQNSTTVCLDKNSGKVIWESGHIPGIANDDYPGYASFTPIENSGFKQLAAFTADYLYGMNIENGKILWTVPFENKRKNNCTDIVYQDGHIFASSGYGRGSILVRLSAKDGKVNAEKIYDIKLMDNHHGGLVLHNGHVYGSGHDFKGWSCIEFKTGNQKWNTKGKGSLVFAEEMLYLYDEDGKITLAKAAADKYTPVSSFPVPSGGKGSYWAHPAISNGVLYLRHADNLYAYDIKQK